MRIDREQFVEELKLRENIRRVIRVVRQRRLIAEGKRLSEEQQLRSIIRNMLLEVEDPEESPHRSTGINVLEDLLKKIIPVIETDFKSLTTDEDQRSSYRAHIVNAIQNALAPEKAMDAIDVSTEVETEPLMEQDVDLDPAGAPPEEVAEDPPRRDRVPAEEAEKFIDIDPPAAEPEPEEPPEVQFAAGADDLLDQTGRNIAYKTFEKIEKTIVDAYAILSNEEDKKLFYDYLITNMKLYFDRFEEELASSLEEPSTPEYEQEIAAGGEEMMPPEGDMGPPMGGEELPPEEPLPPGPPMV